MKFIAKFVLTILFVPIFLVLVLSSSVKYQLLKPIFWQEAFESNGIYPKMAESLRNSADKKIVEGGGNKNDAKILTSVINPENLKDFIERNINNLLGFANAQSKELVIYLPIKKIPKGLLPVNMNKISEEVPLSLLLMKFNIKGVEPASIQRFSKLGSSINYIFVSTLIILMLFTALLFLLVESRHRFIEPAIAFVLSGISLFVLIFLGNLSQLNFFKDLSLNQNNINFSIGLIIQPIVVRVFNYWELVAIVFVVLGTGFTFFKKPEQKQRITRI